MQPEEEEPLSHLELVVLSGTGAIFSALLDQITEEQERRAREEHSDEKR